MTPHDAIAHLTTRRKFAEMIQPRDTDWIAALDRALVALQAHPSEPTTDQGAGTDPVVISGPVNDKLIALWGVIAHISGLSVSTVVREARDAIHDLIRSVQQESAPLPPAPLATVEQARQRVIDRMGRMMGVAVRLDGEAVDALIAAVEAASAQRIAELEQQISDLHAENMCDACGGNGTPTSGLPCMCTGTGRMSDAARTLRVELLNAEQLNHRAQAQLTACEQSRDARTVKDKDDARSDHPSGIRFCDPRDDGRATIESED